ncbi:hypothetical protein FRC07_008223 [Ceratobasidium sp. 392]|nr:hypothetical protein FRC07_008223 [Ceratobasidium sp. 392]
MGCCQKGTVPRQHALYALLEHAVDRPIRAGYAPLRAACTSTAYLATQAPPASEPMPHLSYSCAAKNDPLCVSRAPSTAPAAYADERCVSTSSAGLLPYEYPLEPYWGGRCSSIEQFPAPARAYDDYPDEPAPVLAQSQLAYLLPLDHHSPMQSLGSPSSNLTGIPAAPNLSLQPSSMVAPLSEGPNPPLAQNPGQRTYAFVSLAGSTIRKCLRRHYDEIERLYLCSFEDCTKPCGMLNHLNAHVTMQKHGAKRNPSEFKEL